LGVGRCDCGSSDDSLLQRSRVPACSPVPSTFRSLVRRLDRQSRKQPVEFCNQASLSSVEHAIGRRWNAYLELLSAYRSSAEVHIREMNLPIP